MFDENGRCGDCDGHFTHFAPCQFFTGESSLDVATRVAIFSLVAQ